ncbi:GPW/gp25 family protein [Pectobacterium polaris]|uniref:GPW/gp25 family protein n=1 Tax=Pectobacterium polaris TaxID=2042057 RepID=UPI002B23FA9D|nr:GPW/gp25 family protein [Pectobacterium polaris]
MNTNSVYWQPALQHPGELVEGVADITQAIHIILRTPCGSDPHCPEFGSNLHRYIDYPIDRAIPHVVRETVEAIKRWEPRCKLLAVRPLIDGTHMTLRLSWETTSGVLQATEVLWR